MNTYQLIEILVPLGVCVALPVLIVWLVTRVRKNETDRKAEIMLKAIEAGTPVDPTVFNDNKKKSVKKDLLVLAKEIELEEKNLSEQK